MQQKQPSLSGYESSTDRQCNGSLICNKENYCKITSKRFFNIQIESKYMRCAFTTNKHEMWQRYFFPHVVNMLEA